MGYLLLLIYTLLAPLGAALYAVFFLLSPRRALLRSLLSELPERLALRTPAARGALWVHAASLGEVKAVSRLAPELAAALKAPLLFTCSTAPGRAEAARLGGEALLAPLDFYPLPAALILAALPRALLIAETELWPATLVAAARAGVPVFLVNARLSERTAAAYRLLPPLSRLIFSGVRAVLAQTEADAARYSSLPGLEGKVSVTGNLKHDLLTAHPAGQAEVSAFFGGAGWAGSPALAAGSTHPPEEPVLVDAWLEARKKVPGLKLALVPRHLEKLKGTEALLSERKIPYTLWSRRTEGRPEDCLLVDAMGLLQAFYSVSGLCFVGGTLDDTGGHNVLEPALFSRPALFGPNYRNARQAGDELLKSKGGFLAETAPAMAGLVTRLFTDPAAMAAAETGSRQALASLRGATARTAAALLSSQPL